jgi:hypothetical protein
MGLFSWNCKKCEHSIKSPYNLPTGWEYMNEVVYLRKGHEPVIGKYDGYGRIEGVEESAPTALSTYNMQDDIGFDSDPEVWHKVCWENDGKPGYTSTSEYSSDQGFFYDNPTEEELMEAINATK